MEFINIETIKIANYDFAITDSNSNEYFESFPVIKYSFEKTVNELEYLFKISFNCSQSKQNKTASIRTETIFKLTSTDNIPIELDIETVRLMSDLFYVGWANTIVLMNLRCYESEFTDDYLSKRSIREFYDFLKDNHNLIE
jgi:hypothetical protein